MRRKFLSQCLIALVGVSVLAAANLLLKNQYPPVVPAATIISSNSVVTIPVATPLRVIPYDEFVRGPE